MAELDVDPKLSLLSLEDELTCSICLCPFSYPVTIPCGHNFCQHCILATWKSDYICPQCRTQFDTKPALKKNTVLSTVVEAFTMRSAKTEVPPLPAAEVQGETESEVLCDTCMVKASKTCLTCVASFCEDHLKPHLDNPNLRIHQLTEPLRDLLEHLCPSHHKLMEFYCVQHAHSICSLCLQHVHRGCTFSTPDEQKGLKESDFKNKLHLLDGKIEKNQAIISQIEDLQTKLKDTAEKKKRAFAAEYRQMREILDRNEHEVMCTVDREQESCQTKLKGLLTKFIQNVETMSSAKDCINNLLEQSHSLAFLQASVDLPSVVNFEPHTPRCSLDTKTLSAAQDFAAALKHYLTELFKQSVEARLQMLQPSERPGPAPLLGFGVFPPRRPFPEMPYAQVPNPFKPVLHLRSPSPGAPIKMAQKKKPQKKNRENDGKTPLTDQRPQKQTAKPPQPPKENKKSMRETQSMDNLLDISKEDKAMGQPPLEPTQTPETPDVPPSITSAEKRHNLLKYGAALTLDPKTAHKRVKLSEKLTKASVSDETMDYPDNPARFSACSQVLASKGFAKGCHYWEVKMNNNNFMGIGFAYNSIDRKGPASRLGRNAQSWCVEWFNVMLSAWHAGSETVLANPGPKRVGVLLNCDEGTATFYNVADRAYPFHTFVFPFAETVYPAFWIFSSGSSVTLCSPQG
ncbi:E3 ubiquitin/ISG15 ligase TRIM25 [Lampris incognitus]|uniref:E3 ubiquitin/ISG15 ligase TRIM25 n=1 Tax=Lampris incognitus TaxID=2546036 RepID=UPI0024B4AC93|nr:E3 ubiquitin/ISG15 ligase TRIM25 [Lampris incognitus]